MTKTPGARPISRSFAALAAAMALIGSFAGTAAADPDPTSAAPSTAPSTVEPPASSPAREPSAPPVESSKPAEPEKQAASVERSINVTVDFGKPPHNTNEDVHFVIKLTNDGANRAEDLWVGRTFDKPNNLSVLDWGQLQSGKGVSLDPGTSYEQAVSGKIQDLEQDTAVVRGAVFYKGGMSASQEFTFSVPITKVVGSAAGFVYGDSNGDGKPDEGEKVSGITLTLQYVNGSTKYTATSDAQGNIDFGKIPSATYRLGGGSLGGWLFPSRTVQIGPDTEPLVVRGVPPLNGALKASMAFAKDTYQVGELAHVTVTLSNSGKIPLTGIVAECNRVGNSYILEGDGPGWGDLVWSRGVTIEPGQTRTFDVTEAVPDAALNRGYVVASCDFGYSGVDMENYAQAHDQATVPGGVGALVGDVVYNPGQDKPKQSIAGVKVVLTTDQACPVVSEQTTDEKGHFEFRKLVPGLNYSLYFLPPTGWKIKYDNPTSVDVYAPEDNPARVGIDVEPGDAPLPTVPTQPADCGKTATPTPDTGGGQATGGGGLASTGVDVMGLGSLALATLGLGAGLVFYTRRRRITG